MIDLHVHSTVSDGSNTPTEILKMAYDKKIYALALTDHDNIEGLEEAQREAEKYNIKFIKGIELSVAYGEGRLLHILGLGIDPSNQYFLKVYNKLRKTREEGLEELLRVLATRDVSIGMEDLRNYGAGEYLDRQAVSKYLIDKGICQNAADAWQNYLDPIPYGQGELFEIGEAIESIKKAGGLSFLAHYHKKIGFEGYTKEEMETHMERLVALGLDGIEQYYPSYTEEEAQYAQYLINKYSLLPSGGSDFHGANRADIALGTGDGSFVVPDSVYESIKLRL